MSNNRSLIGSPIFSDVGVTYTPVLSGGSWSLPLSNLQDSELAKVARSTNDDLTSTIIKYDLGVARAVRIAALVNHNISSAGKWRHRLLGGVPIVDDGDISGYGNLATPVVTAGQTDPFGGTRGTLVEDNDAGATEGISKDPVFTGDATKAISIALKAGTAAITTVGLWDVTAATVRAYMQATWSGGVPTLSIAAGAGTVYTPVALGGGWYECSFLAQNVVAANTNRIYFMPAGHSVGGTGTALGYGLMAWDLTTQPILHDTGVDDCWPSGIDAEEYEGYQKALLDPLSAAVTARYGRIEIADTSNADGYVEAGRLAICGAWEPTYAMDVGHRIGWAGSSSSEETDGGAEIHNERRQRRIADVSFGDISHDEALANAFDMQARLGTTKQLFVVLDPDDSTNMHRLSFLGRLRTLSLLEAAHYHRRNIPLAFVEVL